MGFIHSLKIEKVLSSTTFASKSTAKKSFIKIVLPHYFLQVEFFHKRKASSKCVDQRVASLLFLMPSSSLCIQISSFLLLKKSIELTLQALIIVESSFVC